MKFAIEASIIFILGLIGSNLFNVNSLDVKLK
jgi:hypothetical protein